ncbi:uncharacterized protein LOC124606773 [Schistocerca americana]|uniref:uncharacterized protein LOC124606773 n=2 Tax=Schistocerca TaxID=7008 RepID=UPI001F4FBD4A|nr:uncharacterized protein LOC124606773 [Schistocerca americana]XP_049958537.1 uncharacterized protein LOC126475035 [Schistocerca serialis cubense]
MTGATQLAYRIRDANNVWISAVLVFRVVWVLADISPISTDFTDRVNSVVNNFVMVMDVVTSWVIVRRYDQDNKCPQGTDGFSSPPIPIHLNHDSNFMEIKTEIKNCLGLPQDGFEVIKLRNKDGTLITLSTLLQGNSASNPYYLDIARIHQNTPASPRVAFSPTYIETVKNKLDSLEKRVSCVESLVPELRTHRLATIDRTMQQLSSKVNFLDKRLEELAPMEWKAHFPHT